jgi:hypothetical protein
MGGALVWVVLVGVLGLCVERAMGFFCVAMSGSGQHMLLTGFHNLVSSDYGVTFEQIPDFLTLSEQWYGCTVGESGQHMVLGSYMSGLYVSADFGKTWTKSNLVPVDNWYKIAMSAAGDRMAAIYSQNADYRGMGSVMVSTNAGFNWTGTRAFSTVYVDIVSDDSAVFLATIVHNYGQSAGQLLTSDDFGYNWAFANSAPYDSYYALAADSQAQRLFITGSKGVHVTADRGATWTTWANPVAPYLSHLASSASGQQLLASANYRELYASSDFGQSWKVVLNRNDSWASVASNADFSVLAAVSSWGVVVSRDGGATWATPPLSTFSPSARPSQKPVGGLP